MTHASQSQVRPRALVWAIFCLITLVACGGGGGGSGGLVRPEAPPPPLPPPPPPPPPASLDPCPAPITANCIVTGQGVMLEGRTSDHALIVRAGASERFGLVGLTERTFRFTGGTRVESGTLTLGSGNAGSTGYHFFPALLRSNVTVEANGRLAISASARVVGDVANRGHTSLGTGTIEGNLVNDGLFSLDLDYYENHQARILGDFTQSSSGILRFVLPPGSPVSFSTSNLIVTGQARLAGALQLSVYQDDWGPYPLPAPGGHHVLHANGGVFGQFDRWTSPGLFIEGSLRYGSNDVWFDLKRISVQAAMTTAGAAPLALASATNLDRALAGADRFAGVPSTSLSSAQQEFLQSAGRVLWISDPHQAQRSLDSLSGSVHADALHRVGQGDAMSPALGQRLLTLRPGQVAGSWSQSSVNGTVAGFDQWLGSRLLLGASTSIGNSVEASGQARDQKRQAALYLRWFGDNGWYAGGSAGFAHHALSIDRPIDLGRGGRWNAHSQRGMSVASLESEAGRRFTLGGGLLAPYVALGAQVIRSERALEQGATGFELALQANTQARLNAGLGLRFARRWQFGDGVWLQLDADARMQQGLAQAGSPLQAAFIGVPDVGFALPETLDDTAGWMSSLGLRGGTANGWDWSLGHAGSFAGSHPDRQWSLRLQRRF